MNMSQHLPTIHFPIGHTLLHIQEEVRLQNLLSMSKSVVCFGDRLHSPRARHTSAEQLSSHKCLSFRSFLREQFHLRSIQVTVELTCCSIALVSAYTLSYAFVHGLSNTSVSTVSS